jgi:D-glycero-D-manno-heptose 1,7-bisphosphate phosphatase
MALKAIFLDRDGTLNVDDYVTYRPEQFQIIAGVHEGLALFKHLGYALVVITNQGGVGRGAYTLADMHAFHQLLVAELHEFGLTQADIYYCPHDPQTQPCTCCKPNPGLLIQAAADKDIDLSQSFMIGDKHSDILAGQRAGCKGAILLQTGITDDTHKYPVTPDFIARDLLQAALHIQNFYHD